MGFTHESTYKAEAFDYRLKKKEVGLPVKFRGRIKRVIRAELWRFSKRWPMLHRPIQEEDTVYARRRRPGHGHDLELLVACAG